MKFKYADILDNDISDSIKGIAVSIWLQGCHFHCEGCHNENLWDFNGGKDVPDNIIDILSEKISKNGIYRNFSILGGEPLCEENIEFTEYLVKNIRDRFESIKILLWTGYTYEKLKSNNLYSNILSNIDILIDGRYEKDKRDVTLLLRGSSNQRVIDVQESLKQSKIVLYNFK